MYWSFLYRKKRDGESEEDRLLRRLSFKLPIVVRYTGMFVVLFGLLHTALARKIRFRPYLLMSPLVAAFLCNEELRWWLTRPKTPASS
jgi:hypothetical protein